MNMQIEISLIEKAIEHLEIAQKENFAYETDFIINGLKKAIQKANAEKENKGRHSERVGG
jgi:hypothetical protein